MSPTVLSAVLSALLNLVLLAGLPFLFYFLYHRWRHKRGFAEVAGRAGLRLGEPRYIGYSALVALAAVLIFVLWPPPLEPFLRDNSPQRPFVGLGLSGTAVALALLYGVVKTGFNEELLFRGLIAGSLARRMPLLWANLVQALIFLAPHLLVLLTAPELWGVLPIVFIGALIKGWLRIRSGSIVGPWLIHAAMNVITCLSVALRTAS